MLSWLLHMLTFVLVYMVVRALLYITFGVNPSTGEAIAVIVGYSVASAIAAIVVPLPA